MKLSAIVFVLSVVTFPVWADLLLPKEEQRQLELIYQKKLRQCPSDKPLLGIDNQCYDCNALKSIPISGYMLCSEICPNRYSQYECMPKCILKNPPNKQYIYKTCEGWVLSE